MKTGVAQKVPSILLVDFPARRIHTIPQPEEPSVVAADSPIAASSNLPVTPSTEGEAATDEAPAPVKRKRGRPRKNPLAAVTTVPAPKRPRGRPRKHPLPNGQRPNQTKSRFDDLQLYTADNAFRGGRRQRRDVSAAPSVLVTRVTGSDSSRFTFNAAAVRLFGGKGNFGAIQFSYSEHEQSIVVFPVPAGIPGAYALSQSAGNTVQVTPGAFCSRYLKDKLPPGRYPVHGVGIPTPDWAAAPRGFVIPLRERNKVLERTG